MSPNTIKFSVIVVILGTIFAVTGMVVEYKRGVTEADTSLSKESGEPMFGAPQYRLERTLLPEADSAYDLGTSSRAWRQVFADEFCLTADICIPLWPTGGSGGSGNVATSSQETATFIPFWTSTNGTPAELSGGEANLAYNATDNRLTATYGSSTAWSAVNFIGAFIGNLTGNAGTATALQNDGTDCSSGQAAGGVDASGNAEDCTDYWTEAENTSAAYTPQSRTLTVAGTASQIVSSAGAQDLSANRTWTLSVAPRFQFPLSYESAYGTTTYASSTGLSTTYASTSNLTVSGLQNGLLEVNATGGVQLATAGSDYEVPITFDDGLSRTANDVDFVCTEVEGTGINCSANDITLDATGDWTGTFDGQQGTWYIDRANHSGTQAASTITAGTFGVGNYVFQAPTNVVIPYASTTYVSSDIASTTNFFGAMLRTCASGSMLTWTAGLFGCEADDVGTTNTDIVLWANATTSLWNVANVLATGSSTLTRLDTVYGTTTNSTSTQLSVSTHLRSQGTTRLDNMTSALLLTGTTGIVAEYAGTSCTNQFVRALSALGAATCETVANTDLANSTVSYGGITLSLGGTDATPAFNLADATGLPIDAGTTGTLPLSRGGTNATSFTTTGNAVYYDGTRLVTAANTAVNTNYASTTYISTATASTTNLNISSLLATRIPYAGAAGAITSNSNLAFGGASGITLIAPYASSTYISTAAASTSALTISGIGSATNNLLTISSTGVVSATSISSFTSSSKWATTTGAYVGIAPAGASVVGIGTTTPRSLLHLATSTAPQLLLSDGFPSSPGVFLRNINGNLYLGTSTPNTNASTTKFIVKIGSNGTTTIQGPLSATSSSYYYSSGSGKGGSVILEDSDGAGCTEVMALNGILSAITVTCPSESE